jgi:peroxiredoxin Q/BCP
MMGASRDGHTFILVKPDGTIAWRADYGGTPKYTMFVPTTGVLADLRADTHTTAGATP